LIPCGECIGSPMSARAMRARYALTLLLLLTGSYRGIGVAGAAPISASRVLVVDLDGDGRAERVELRADRDPSVSVWRGTDASGEACRGAGGRGS